MRLLSEIHRNWDSDTVPTAFALRKSWGEWSSIAADQYALHEKAAAKLPEWVASHCLFERRSLQQCTSSAVALAKAALFARRIPKLPVVDLCAGFGVDAWAWSLQPRTVYAVERDPALHQLASCNVDIMQQGVKRICADAESEFLTWRREQVLFLADPDRRDGDKRLGANLDAYQPNIWPWVEQRSPGQHWLIKLSPMTDIHSINSRTQQPFDAYWVAYGSETKELLLHVHDQAQGNRDVLFAFDEEPTKLWSTLFDESSHVQSEKHYLFEPHSAAFASRLNQSIRGDWYRPLTAKCSFFETQQKGEPCLGRLYKLKAQFEGSLNSIYKELRAMGISKASVTVRECKISADDVRAKLQLKEDSSTFVFVTQSKQGFKAWLVSD